MTPGGQIPLDQAAADRIDDGTSLQLQFECLATTMAVAADDSAHAHVSSDKADEENLQVPVIDLAGLAEGNAAGRERIVREIIQACETWGMFQVVNHGVPEEILQELDKQARDFFAMPLEVKERVNFGIGANYQQEGFLRRLQPDPLYTAWRESLAYASTWSQTKAMIDRVWPNGNAPFIDFLQEYFLTVEELSMILMEIVAEGLGLESNFFSQQLQSDFDNKRLRWRTNFYPPRPEANFTLGLTAHSDPNLLSLLSQDGVGGLQAKKGDHWVDVTAIPGALVVNAGDCLEAWSNGRLKSVVHRAVVSNTQHRVSWVFLLTPPTSLLLQTPPKLIDDKHPQLFKPVTYEDLANNLFEKVSSARKSQEPQKLLPKRIFYEYALLRP